MKLIALEMERIRENPRKNESLVRRIMPSIADGQKKVKCSICFKHLAVSTVVSSHFPGTHTELLKSLAKLVRQRSL